MESNRNPHSSLRGPLLRLPLTADSISSLAMAGRERIGSVAHIKHPIGCLHAVGQIPWQKQRFPVGTRLVRYEAGYGHGAQLDQLARCRPGNGGIVDDVALFGDLGVPDEAD